MKHFERVLRKGRAAFEERMRASCKVERTDGTVVDEYGVEHPNIVTVYESLPCYINYDGVPFESTYDSVGVSVVQGRVELVTRVDADVVIDDVITIESDPDNPSLVGAQFRAASQVPRSQGTRQRVLLEDNQKGVKVNEPQVQDSDD